MASLTEQQYRTLALEASMASGALGVGLTSLRNYSFADQGSFYSAAHMISIGLERLFKWICVYDVLISTGAMPDNKYLKENIGHKIKSLVTRARQVNAAGGYGVDESLFGDSITKGIVQFVDDFANRTRYYNLDRLTGAGKPQDVEPLAQWQRHVAAKIVERHYKEPIVKTKEQLFARILDNSPGILVKHDAEDGSSISSMSALVRASRQVAVKQRYGVFYVHRLLRFGSDLLTKVEFKVTPVSTLYEFFLRFGFTDRTSILRRKRWDV